MLCAFFFDDTATTEIYTLSLHDALPIFDKVGADFNLAFELHCTVRDHNRVAVIAWQGRSEEHTSELQSHVNLVCRLLLEKKKKTPHPTAPNANITHRRPTSHLTFPLTHT